MANLLVQKRPGKRRRPSGIRASVAAALQWATFWAGVPGVATQFTDCRERLVQNNDNGDTFLTASDFQNFIIDFTEGKIRLDMESPTRTAIHQAFDVRLDETLGGVDLSTMQEEIDLFCESIYMSFFPIFNVSVSGTECSASLFDFAFGDGEIDQADFAGVASALTGETFDAFEDLSSTVQNVYTDFEGENEVIEITFLSSQPSLANLFCRRVVLGHAVDGDVIIDIPGTIQSTPTQSPVTVSPSCVDDLRLADGNDDELLSESEYVVLLNTFSDDAFLFETFDELPFVLRDHFEWLKFGSEQVDLGGIHSANATEDELRPLGWICSQTEALIALDATGNATAARDPFLTDCIIASISADNDQDGHLSLDEFTNAISAAYDTGASPPLAPSIVQEVFDNVSNGTDTINISGAGRYQLPDDRALLGFGVLCDAISTLFNGTDSSSNTTVPTAAPSSLNFTTLAPTTGNMTTVPSSAENATSSPLSTFAPTLFGNVTTAPTLPENQTAVPSETTTPSNRQTAAPSEVNSPTIAPTMSPADFRQCTLSMLVCDRNRDNLMQTSEFVIFLNRQTENVFAGETYDSLDPLFRLLFDSLRQSEEFPSLVGSKPGSSPTTDETVNLMRICSETERTYTEYAKTIQFQPTSSPTSQPTGALGQEEVLTTAQLNQCKLFLFVSDGNRDSELDQSEFVTFVNRLTVNAFLGRAYLELPLLFRDVFATASGSTGTISTVGARSGQPASAEQLNTLATLCEDSYLATNVWKETRTEAPTMAPTDPPNTAPPPTPPPSLSSSDFLTCTTSLAVTDRNRDDFIDQTEYVEFINRLTNNIYLGLSFSAIDPRLQSNYRALSSPSGFISAAGARPGSRTEDQAAALYRVCSETDKVVENLDQGVTPPVSPTVAPTQQPATSQPTDSISAVELAQCQAFVSVSDADRNKFLTQIEYVNFLNAISETGFVGRTFGGLDTAFQEAFRTFQSTNGSINILGSRPSDITPPEQLALIKSFCVLVFEAFEEFNNKPPPSLPPSSLDPSEDPNVLECIATLDSVDFGGDQYVDRLEYVVYISEISNMTYPFDTPFSSLPYVLQDNFGWISEVSSKINIAGAENVTQLAGTSRLDQLARLCRRTDIVVSSVLEGNNETDLIPHCYRSLTVADRDEDSFLNATEFAFMVNFFQGLDLVESGFTNLDKPFQAVFEANKGTLTGSINVEGSKLNENPNPGQALLLEYLCGEISRAVNEARGDYQLLRQCVDGIVQANIDTDNFLNQDEYVDFVYAFAGQQRAQNTYVNLPPDLLLNFEKLRIAGADRINIVGWRGDQVSEEEARNIQIVCSETKSAIDAGFGSLGTPTQAPTQALTSGPTLENTISGEFQSVTVYNGFLLKSDDELTVVDLRNADIIGLEGAYRVFVNSTVDPLLSSNRLRGRRLGVTGFSFESAKVYQILDGICSESVSDPCLEAYASFDLIVLQTEDVDTVVSQYTGFTQAAIAGGDLQDIYESLSPDRRFDIVGVTEKLQPGTSAPSPQDGVSLAPTNAPAPGPTSPSTDSDGDGDGGGVPILYLVLAVAVAIALGVCWYCCFNRRKKQPAQNTTENDDEKQVQQYPSQTDDEENYPSAEMGGEEMDPMQSVAPTRTPDPLLSRSEHSTEPQFGFSPGSSDQYDTVHGRIPHAQPSLETIPDEAPLWSPTESSPSESYHGENPWGAMSADGVPSAPHTSDSSSSSDDYVEGPTEYEQEEVARSVGSGSSESEENVKEEFETADSISEEGEEEAVFEDNDNDASVQEEEVSDEASEASTLNDSYISMSAEQRQAQIQYRKEVEKLVAIVVPDELENVEVMVSTVMVEF
eukprot:scaffold32086_cov183-Amphora_coffeaeformis.AAC.7